LIQNKFIFIIIIIFFFNSNIIFSNIFSDLTSDYTATIELNTKKDLSDDSIIDQTSDTTIGNKWYSRHNFYFFSTLEIGISGSKDYIGEYALYKYKFKSKTRHAFGLRLFHSGFTTGAFTGNFNFYNFCFLTGFEYFYKIFSKNEGFFIWTDIGGCNNGFAAGFGLGLGSRVKNGAEIWVVYLYNVGVFSRLEFNFLLFNILTLRGKLGIDFKYYDLNMELFTFLSGAYIGLFIKNVFRIELGGGFTINEYSRFGGFGSISLTLNIF